MFRICVMFSAVQCASLSNTLVFLSASVARGVRHPIIAAKLWLRVRLKHRFVGAYSALSKMRNLAYTSHLILRWTLCCTLNGVQPGSFFTFAWQPPWRSITVRPARVVQSSLQLRLYFTGFTFWIRSSSVRSTGNPRKAKKKKEKNNIYIYIYIYEQIYTYKN